MSGPANKFAGHRPRPSLPVSTTLVRPRFGHHVQSKWTRASLGLSRGSVRAHVAPVDHDDAACQAASSEVLNYFVRRMERAGWDSAAIRESIVSTASGDVTDVWMAMRRVYGLGVKETALMESPWLENALENGMEDWTGSMTIESIGSLDERDLSGGTLRKQHAPRVFLKMESTQPTGAFKVRGACNALAERLKEDPGTRFTISSTGNHALACLHALKAISAAGNGEAGAPDDESMLDIYLPGSVSKRKLAKIERQAALVGPGAVNVFVLDGVADCVEAEMQARREAEAAGRYYVSPYNNDKVIAGHGTLAMELLMELGPSQLDYVFVPVGGGGLITGIARVLKALAPHVRIVGCQAAACPVMARSVDEGSIVDWECVDWNETLAEGLAGGIESDSRTFEACKTLVDAWVTVEEKEIAEAMVGMHGHHGAQIEGAAAVMLAAIVKMGSQMRDKTVVGVVCGGNLDSRDLDRAYDLVRARDVRAGASKAAHF